MKMRGLKCCLTGKKLTEETAIEAAEIALKNAIPLAINDYKIDMAKSYGAEIF